LKAPGFTIAMTETPLLGHFPDVSAQDGFALGLKNVGGNITKFRFAFCDSRVNYARCQFQSFKANVLVPQTGDVVEVFVPWSKFSDKWSSYTGEHTAENPPTASSLKSITQLQLWTEGVLGDFDLEIHYVRARKAPAAALAEPLNSDGALKITWNDCGDASTHAKVASFQPNSLPLGTPTTLTGTGNVDEAITGGTFELDLTTSVISPKWTGNICEAKTFDLPLGLGSVTWTGLKCPTAAGTVAVPLEVKMSSAIPASMASAKIHATAVLPNGDKLMCLNVNLDKASSESLIVV